MIGIFQLSRAQFSLPVAGPNPKFRFSFDITNNVFFIEQIGVDSGYYRFDNVDFSKAGLSIHFHMGPGSVIIEPAISLAQLQSNPNLAINGNQITCAGGDEWAFGASINTLGDVRSFTLTPYGMPTHIGICDPATIPGTPCYDFGSYSGWINELVSGFTYTCYPCDCSCTSGQCYGPGAGLCCHTACATCIGPTNKGCLTCNSGFYLQPLSTTCLTTCPPLYWPNPDGNICSLCEPVSGGSVSVSPSTGGVPLSTSFSLTIQGWTLQNGGNSLLYSVSYSTDGSMENSVLISDFSSATKTSFYLPNSSSITIIVTIKEVPSGCLTNISTQVSLSTQRASIETALSTATAFAQTALSEGSTSSINILAGQISLIDSQLAGSSSENSNCSLSVTVQCSNHGTCNTNWSRCECYEGYYLADCSMTEDLYNQQLEYRQNLIESAARAILEDSGAASLATLNSLLNLITVLTEDPFLNSNVTLPTALDSVNNSINLLKILSGDGDDLTSSIENMVGILSNVQNQISSTDCLMATTFSSEATNQTYQYLDELSNLILQDLSVGQENTIKTSDLILYSATIDANDLTNFMIAPDSAAPKITLGDLVGQNIASSSIAITYIYSKSKNGCTNNPKQDFVIEVKDGSSLQPLQNFNIPINVIYNASVFGSIKCAGGCKATADTNGDLVCSCQDISIFDVKNQLARIYENSQLKYLTINNLLDVLYNPPYSKWSFWVIIGSSIGLILTLIIVNTVNKKFCVIAKTRESRKKQQNKNSNLCKIAGLVLIMAHPLIGIFIYNDRAINKSFRALLYYQRAMIILAYSAIFASDPSFKAVILNYDN